jgi:acyl transferase domain-containing protein/acyl carrier protein
VSKSGKQPIAIIGIGCRFPGSVTDPESFWKLLKDGVDAVGEIPPDRFDLETYYDPLPGTPGKTVSRWGGFLQQIDRFDPYFFGISPREAERLDPQQRVLLEVAWEALEDSGLVPNKLVSSKVGVYIGLWLNDFENRLYKHPDKIDFYMTTGSGRYTASGRISYFLGLQGPSLTVDTHCSSSLVAVHLACQSIWSGECSLALAGGVNIILQPQISIAYSQSDMISPQGRCKFGDASADGYVRSEGAGLVVLKPLEQAVADGDPIYALILSSAVNNDGKSSGYLATPALHGQETLLQQAYSQAGISPGLVSYVEAHGSGTSSGDPVELEALGKILALGRKPGQPCAIGSVKTNIGHTEGAAGIAGLIKVALCIKNRAIPPSLHLNAPNPKIAWDKLPLYIPTELQAWPETGAALYAGVSSFGIAGTNAHAVLSEAPRPATIDRPMDDGEVQWDLLALSARTQKALRATADRYAKFLSEGGLPTLRDICFTSQLRRAHHEHRLAVITKSRTDASQALNEYLKGIRRPDIVSNYADFTHQPRLVFVFPGQGSQWLGMGRDLFEHVPVFRESILRFDRSMQSLTDWSISEQLSLDPSDNNYRMDRIDVIQPVLLAIEIGLAELWMSWGVQPDAVIGHSMGEIGAAYISGVFDIQKTARLVCLRSRLLKQISGQGAMAVIGLPLEQVLEEIKGYENVLSVAVSNSYRSTVIAGDPIALAQVMATLADKNIFCRLIDVDVAAHSPQVQPLMGELVHELEGLEPGLAPRSGNIPIYSTASGSVTDGADFGAAYWANNLRNPVMFSEMMERLLSDGYNLFIELSPHPVLATAMEETIGHLEADALVVASLRRNEPGIRNLLAGAGKLYTLGYPLDFEKLFPDKGQPVKLPAYAWQRKRYWLDLMDSDVEVIPGVKIDHPLLGRRLPDLAQLPGKYIWENRVNGQFQKLYQGGLVEDTGAFSESFYRKMALQAAKEVFGAKTHTLTGVEINTPLQSNGNNERTLQLVVESGQSALASGMASFKLYSRDPGEAGWVENAAARLKLGEVSMDWFYELNWLTKTNESINGVKSETEAGHWLIFADRSGVADELTQKLESHNHTCKLLYRQDSSLSTPPGSITIDPGDPQEFKRALADILSEAKSQCKGILYLWNLDISGFFDINNMSEFQTAQQIACNWVVSLVQAQVAQGLPEQAKLWLVTVDAQPAVLEDRANVHTSVAIGAPLSLTQALTWGLGRTIALEHPEIWGGLIDLPNSYSPSSAAANLFDEIQNPDGEDQICFRDGQRYVARLDRVSEPDTGGKPLSIDLEGTYLITGGLGFIGLSLARWLVDRQAKNIVLVSRTGLPEPELWNSVDSESQVGKRIQAMQALQNTGANISVACLDVADPAQMSGLFNQINNSEHPLKGVIHAAGVFDYRSIVETDPVMLDKVLRSKVTGTWLLNELTKDLPLDFFILFSSSTAILGSQGLSIYAAANTFQDRIAHFRTYAGIPGLSVNWGWWVGDRLDETEKEITDLASNSGSRQMQAGLAIEALEYLIQTGVAQKVVADFDWNIIKPLYESKRARPLLANMKVEKQSISLDEVDLQKSDFLKKLAKSAKNKRKEILRSHIGEHVKAILGIDPAEPIDVQQGFFKLGLDSLMSMQLHNRLEASFNISWPTTVALEYPSIATLADYINDEVLPLLLEENLPPASINVEIPVVAAEPPETNLDEISDQDLMSLLDGELSRINDLLEGD